jgi:colanic acid biosynthesis glycosyl transferase WcaI
VREESSRQIIFINRFFYPDQSATSQILTDLTVDIAASGLRPVVITSRQLFHDSTARLPSHAQFAGVKIIRVWGTRFGRQRLVGRAIDYISFYLSSLLILLAFVRREDVLIAKTDPPLISVIAMVVANVRGARLVNWLQDIFPEVAIKLGVTGLSGPAGKLLTLIRNRSLRFARLNVVLGERMREMVAQLGVTKDRISIIPNWADSQAIRAVEHDVNPLRKAWGLEGKFVVGYSGNMGRAHEFETIIEVIRLLREDERFLFLFVGSGNRRGWIEEQARHFGLGSRIAFQNFQDRNALSESLSAIDIHLVTLRPELEGLIVPSKIYGVFAAGRPTLFIGDEYGEVALALTRAGSGRAFKPGSVEAIVKWLQQLAKNPELMGNMGRNARSDLMQQFDRHHAVARWIRALQEV